MERLLDSLRSGSVAQQAWLQSLQSLGGEDAHVGARTAMPATSTPAPAFGDELLPTADALPETLVDLACPHEDINELVALRDRMLGDPELRWLLERSVTTLVQAIGRIDDPVDLPLLPDQLGAIGRYFYVFVCIAALPHIRAYHRARGIPADVSRRTLADLGRQMTVHRRQRGSGGLLVPKWLRLHFRGELYQLGRLQFQRARLDPTEEGLAAAGMPLLPDNSALSIHIPDFSGPMTPTACDTSLRRACEFFPRYFPEEEYLVAVCHSWLLDEQLSTHLPERSNIVQFQRRFHIARDELGPRDSVVVGFVFGDPALPVGRLPRRTSLERAIGDHLRRGGHWYVRWGWFPL